MRADAAKPADPSPRWPVAAVARGAPQKAPKPQPQRTATDAAALEAARQAANRALTEKGSELAFEFNDDLNRVIVKLIDRRTREVIRQLPSEAVLAIASALAEGAHPGTVVHTRA